jgi:hypothetical protein
MRATQFSRQTNSKTAFNRDNTGDAAFKGDGLVEIITDYTLVKYGRAV